MALPPFDEAITPFILHNLGVQNGEFLKKIRQSWKSVIRKGLEWGPRSYKASPSYKAWLKDRLEESDPSHAKPYGSSKWKPESSLEQPGREDANKRACREKESWSRAIA
ncbi:hypothetical protein CR513_19460, partial [Mucuna pruriens]